MKSYFIIVNGNQSGPHAVSQLLQNGVQRDTLVWAEGMHDWVIAQNVPELQYLFPNQPYANQQQQVGYNKHFGTQQQAPQHGDYYGSGQNYNNAIGPVIHTVTEEKIERKWKIYSTCIWIAAPLIFIGGITVSILQSAYPYYWEAIQLAYTCVILSFLTLFIVALVNQLTILYHSWLAIQDGGRARTTPGPAVGLLFVPIFFLYQNFVSYRGLTEDMNNYQMMRNMNYRKIDEGLATAYGIICLCYIIPVVNILALLGNFIILFLTMKQQKEALIHIIREKQRIE